MGGILTSAEFDRKQKQEGLLHSPSGRKKELPSNEKLAAHGLAKRRRLILPIAPAKGESKAGFYLDGKEVQLTLVDQEYVFPDNMTEAQKDKKAKALAVAGFVDESTIVKIEPVVKPLRFAHPDNEVGNPVQGEVKFKFKHRKKKYNFVMELDEFGTIATDDPVLLQQLRKDGWPEVTLPDGVVSIELDVEETEDEESPNDSGIVTADDEPDDDEILENSVDEEEQTGDSDPEPDPDESDESGK